MEKQELLEKIQENILEARITREDPGFSGELEGTPGVSELVEQALQQGIEAGELVNDALTAGLTRVGQLFEEGELFLPEMLLASQTVVGAMDSLKDRLVKGDIEQKGKIVLATVEGDIHDIGKNIVCLVLQGAGYEVIDLGVDVKTDSIVEALKESGANILGLSALLTSTMVNMREVIDQLEKAGIRDSVTVLVGGAPVSSEFAVEIGADHYGKNAFEAVKIADGVAA